MWRGYFSSWFWGLGGFSWQSSWVNSYWWQITLSLCQNFRQITRQTPSTFSALFDYHPNGDGLIHHREFSDCKIKLKCRYFFCIQKFDFFFFTFFLLFGKEENLNRKFHCFFSLSLSSPKAYFLFLSSYLGIPSQCWNRRWTILLLQTFQFSSISWEILIQFFPIRTPSDNNMWFLPLSHNLNIKKYLLWIFRQML